jgi:hypothetical protein
MRCIPFLAVAGLLAGCSMLSAVPQAWNWDPASRPVAVTGDAPPISAAPVARLTELRLQREEIRIRIAAEPHIGQRQVLYAQLHEIGRQLSPLERQADVSNPAR